MNIMENYKVGQIVFYRDTSFDAGNELIKCIVKFVQPTSMVITDVKTNTDLYIREGFNSNCVISGGKRYEGI